MTTSPLIVNNTRPERDFDGVAQIGFKVYDLANLYKVEIEKRVPMGVIPGLKEDLTSLVSAVPGAEEAHAEAEQATEDRDATLERACHRLTGMRKTVRNAKAPKAVQHAYGVGRNLNPRLGIKVRSTIKMVLDRIAAHPEEVAEFCFAQEDIDALTLVQGDVADASLDQQKKRASAPQTTKDRNIIANRILRAAQRITGAGALAFADKPQVRALFDAIHVTPPKKGKKKGGQPI